MMQPTATLDSIASAIIADLNASALRDRDNYLQTRELYTPDVFADIIIDETYEDDTMLIFENPEFIHELSDEDLTKLHAMIVTTIESLDELISPTPTQ